MKARHEFQSDAEYREYLLHYYAGQALQGRIAAFPTTNAGYEAQSKAWKEDYGDVTIGQAIALDAYNFARSLVEEII